MKKLQLQLDGIKNEQMDKGIPAPKKVLIFQSADFNPQKLSGGTA